MTSDAFFWGDVLGAIATASFFGWVGWAVLQRRRRRGGEPIDDEPAETAYTIFTAAYDVVVSARNAPALLARADAGLPPARPLTTPSWPARLAAVERHADEARPAFDEAARRLSATFEHRRGQVAVSLLIDQSGSMHESILLVAASVRWLSRLSDGHGVSLAVNGFTTLGWRGGEPRRRWLAAGCPARPGRLCALLHLRYCEFDRPLADDDFRAMAHPGVLRENIDGEAIAWAATELAARPEPLKLLIVLSDGAPVDDSTIAENGVGFLVRHARAIIRDTEAAGLIRLGAVGLDHRVSEWYDYAVDTVESTALPTALATLINMLAPGPSPDAHLREPG